MSSVGVWIVLADCGDHYCGCDGGHVVGVSPSSQEADRIRGEAEAAKRPGFESRRWFEVMPPVMVPIDTLLDGQLT